MTPPSYRFPLWNRGGIAATLRIDIFVHSIIAHRIPADLISSFSSAPSFTADIHNIPPEGPLSGTPIVLVFYEDDIALHYHSFDRFFSAFSSLRLPLSARHLSDLRSFPLSLDAFLVYHFGNDLVNHYISQPILPPEDR